MQSPLLAAALAVAATVTTASAEFLPKDVYLKFGAPKALAKISDYRTAHTNLTLPQQMVLNLSEQVITEFAVNDLSALEAMCMAAFNDKQECHSLLGDDSGKALASRGDNLKRDPDCECSTGVDFCYMRGTIDFKCRKSGDKVSKCEYSSCKLFKAHSLHFPADISFLHLVILT